MSSVFMIGGFMHPHSSPFLNWESEGLNRNQFLQFIFNFFLLSQYWFLSLWSMAERIAPWPEQLFKQSVWSTPHLLNGTSEADYESNRMKMFKGWAWLPLPSWRKMPSGGGWVRQRDILLFPVGKTYQGEAGKRGGLGDQLLVCQPDSLPPFLLSSFLFFLLLFHPYYINSVRFRTASKTSVGKKKGNWLVLLSLCFLGFKIVWFFTLHSLLFLPCFLLIQLVCNGSMKLDTYPLSL